MENHLQKRWKSINETFFQIMNVWNSKSQGNQQTTSAKFLQGFETM